MEVYQRNILEIEQEQTQPIPICSSLCSKREQFRQNYRKAQLQQQFQIKRNQANNHIDNQYVDPMPLLRKLRNNEIEFCKLVRLLTYSEIKNKGEISEFLRITIEENQKGEIVDCCKELLRAI